MPRSAGRIRVEGRLVGRRLATSAGQSLGVRMRDARTRRRWSQQSLGGKVGLSTSRISQIERGLARSVPLEIWFALSHVLGIPLRIELSRDVLNDVVDAGHLRLQELALHLGRETGRKAYFELATKPADPSYSIDVCQRDDGLRILLICECWNTFANVNASVRSTRRKVAEAEQFAVAAGADGAPYEVAAVWIVRDTRANRALVLRYPEVFESAFPASSARWVRALTTAGQRPPVQLGLVWADVNATRVFAWRKQ